MNDDIVNGLRSSAQWIAEMEHESWIGTAELQREAADEIERLEAEMQQVRLDHITTLGELQESMAKLVRLRAAGDALVESLDAGKWAVDVVPAVKAWNEARRG